MKNNEHQNLRRWSVIGIFVIFAVAGIWHFLYEWLPCPLTAVLSPVNESTWEHAKLFFMPVIIYFLFGRLTVGKAYPNFTFAHAAVLPVMPLLMLGIYYLLRVLGVESLAFDLVNTLIVIMLGVYASYRLTLSDKRNDSRKILAAAVAIVLGLLIIFAAFTFFPPHIPVFQDSNTLRYGIPLK